MTMTRNSPDSKPHRVAASRSGLVLVVVLVMVTLLALLAASYSFMVQSNTRAAISNHYRFQAHMAAESGFQRAVAVLRAARNEPGIWYSNPDLFKGVLIEGTESDLSEAEANLKQRNETGWYDPAAKPAWRFNLVARNYEDPTTVRYGITDECSKLDLNGASEAQLRRLFELVIPQDTTNAVDINVLVDSLLDWREPGAAARANGAKDEYYSQLEPPYRCKSAPFSTVEELLLVKGFTAWVVFGEDYNRNGLLDPNENDNDSSFPPDNGDGALFAGVAPYFTLWSRELNVSNDQRPRINLNMEDTQKLQELLEEQFSPAIVSYVMEVRGGGAPFNSIMNLIPAPPTPESEEDPQDLQPTTQPDPFAQDPATSQPTTNPADGIDTGLEQPPTDLSQSGEASENSQISKPPEFKDLTATPPPGTYEDLPLILDRLTTDPVPMFTGRINVNTASREVLATIPELTAGEVEAIVAARGGLAPEERSNSAWLVRNAVLELHKYRWILPKLATKSSVFQVESVGYADHAGVMDRINVIFEMRGPIAQVIYTRNLDELGTAYTPHGEDIRAVQENTNQGN